MLAQWFMVSYVRAMLNIWADLIRSSRWEYVSMYQLCSVEGSMKICIHFLIPLVLLMVDFLIYNPTYASSFTRYFCQSNHYSRFELPFETAEFSFILSLSNLPSLSRMTFLVGRNVICLWFIFVDFHVVFFFLYF